MTKLVFKTQPRPYQIPALRKIIRNGGGGLYVPMRWGKSWLAINWAAAMALKNFPNQVVRVLITCPNDVKAEWEEQFELHCPVEFRIMESPIKERLVNPLQGTRLDVLIKNNEAMYYRVYDNPKNRREWAAVTDPALLAWQPHVHILDEAHHHGNPSAVTSVKTAQVARTAYHRLFLTGTPFHRKPIYVYGQFRFYDPSIIGMGFSHFKKFITITGGFGNYEVKGYRNLKWLRNKIKPHVWISKKKPVGEPPVKRRILFSLEESKHIYREMERESVVQLRDTFAVADIILTRHLRLQQIAGGFLKDTEGKLHHVGSEKRKAFARRVDEYREQDITRFVVGCRFLKEIVDVVEVVKAAGYRPLVVHGGVPPVRRKEKRRIFAAEENTVFIAQFRASREGVDLSAADLMVFYSLPEDYLTYDQFSQRIYKFEDTRTLLYEHMIAKGTRDEVNFEAIKLQQDVAAYLMKHPKYVEKITSRL